MKQNLKPLIRWAPILRCDDEERIVEAYAFVNEVVPGEGGWCLSREAMEAATNDYMKWANIREMHQAIASGVCLSVTWDAIGALMRIRVVDDNAWKKVKERVYKGLSVGVRATLMQGKKVLACEWFETSLCDRPKDQDALILSFRADVAHDSEYEVEVLPDEQEGLSIMKKETEKDAAAQSETVEKPTEDAPAETAPAEVERAEGEVVVEVTVNDTEVATVATPAPATFDSYLQSSKDGQAVAALENNFFDAYYALMNVLDGIYFSEVENKPELVKAALQQFADYLNSMVSDTERCNGGQVIKDAIVRFQNAALGGLASAVVPEAITQRAHLEATNTELLQRVQTAEATASEATTELARVQGELKTTAVDLSTAEGTVQNLQQEVTRLKAVPRTTAPPLRFTQGAQREFAANSDQAPANVEATALRARYAELTSTLRSETSEAARNTGVQEMQRIKMKLQTMGEALPA